MNPFGLFLLMWLSFIVILTATWFTERQHRWFSLTLSSIVVALFWLMVYRYAD